jgi:hypothetical protein
MLTYHVLGIPLIIALLLVFPALLIVMGTATWVDRRLADKRGRQPRLAVNDSGAVDRPRSTTVVRRDDIEPAPMIAGSAAAAIAADIERTAPARNEFPAAVQTFAASENAGAWRNPPHPRSIDPEPPPRPPPEWPAPIDLDEISAMRPGEAPESEPIQEPETARDNQPVRIDEPGPPPAVTAPDFSADSDQELADIAKRLKASIRGLVKKDAARPAEPAQTTMIASPPPTGSRTVDAPMATPVARANPKSIYDALETEMSSGRGVPDDH